MKKKQYHLMRGWIYIVGALVILSTPVWSEKDIDGLGFAILFVVAAILGYVSYRHFKQIKESREEDMVNAPATDATAEEQIKFYKRNVYIGLIAFPLLTLIVTLDLNELVSGSVQSVTLWAPVAFLFEQFGYWTAVLSVPVVGVFVILLNLRKIDLIRSQV